MRSDRILLLLLPLLASIGSVCCDVVNYRLPNTVEPLHYVLQISPRFIEPDDHGLEFSFAGRVQINVRPRIDVTTLTLHASPEKLAVADTEISIVTGDGAEEIRVVDVRRDDVTEFLMVSVERALRAHVLYMVSIPFAGSLIDENAIGFFRSNYSVNGDNFWMASTHFEAIRARRAFPCFDEPALKATFHIQINHSAHYFALSNMQRLGDPVSIGINRLQTSFKTSVPMSTYLVAFVVCQYANLTNTARNATIFTRPDLLELAPRSMDVTAKTVRKLATFLGVELPLEKLDQVTVPRYILGAMENMGLITYPEKLLLFNPVEDTSDNKEGVFRAIAHEISHQWFGNHVGIHWWSYMWLKEGFAIYLMYRIMDSVVQELEEEFEEIDWRLMDRFAVDVRQGAAFPADFELDIPMTRRVESPAEIDQIFDEFSYEKGGSFLFMMENILTQRIFRKGLYYYLTDKAYRTAEPADLWRNLQRAYDESSFEPEVSLLGRHTIADIGNSFTLHGRCPLVSVSKSGNQVTLSQEIFRNKSESITEHSDWIIPINYASGSALDFSRTSATWWLGKEPMVISLNNSEHTWILVNNQQTGYYRVNYDLDTWREVTRAFGNSSILPHIPKVTLSQLLDDALVLSKTGHLPYGQITLPFVQFLRVEIDYIPWLAAIRQFAYLDKLLVDAPCYQKYQANQIELIGRTYAAVRGFNVTPADGQTLKLHRNQILTRACFLGHAECRRDAELALGEVLMSELSFVEPDLRWPVYCGGLRGGNSTLYAGLFDRYRANTTSADEKNLIGNALACYEDLPNIFRKLTALTGSEEISSMDRAIEIVKISRSNSKAFNIALDFLEKNIRNLLKDLDSELQVIIMNWMPYFTSKTHRSSLVFLEMYVNAHENSGERLKETLKKALIQVDQNIDWTHRNMKDICDFFD